MFSRFFWAPSCLMVDKLFDQKTYVCEEWNNFQDSKLIFMISDFKFFSTMLLGHVNCGKAIVLKIPKAISLNTVL